MYHQCIGFSVILYICTYRRNTYTILIYITCIYIYVYIYTYVLIKKIFHISSTDYVWAPVAPVLTLWLWIPPQGLIEPGLSQLQEQAMRCGLLMEDREIYGCFHSHGGMFQNGWWKKHVYNGKSDENGWFRATSIEMETSMLALSCWWFRWLSWRFTWVFFFSSTHGCKIWLFWLQHIPTPISMIRITMSINDISFHQTLFLSDYMCILYVSLSIYI